MALIRNVFIQFCDWVERIIYWLVFVLLGSLLAIVFIQILTRYFMENPWLWTIDFALLCLIWLTMLGAGICVRHEAHFTIDIWPPHWKKTSVVLSWLSIVMIVIIAGYYLFGGLGYMMSNIHSVTGMTRVPMIYFLAAIPVGSMLMILFAVEWVLSQFFNQREENKA